MGAEGRVYSRMTKGVTCKETKDITYYAKQKSREEHSYKGNRICKGSWEKRRICKASGAMVRAEEKR